ncbi:hypothetical protein PR048_028604 [Dryococelus australis]|uniref:BESS domain-containing protein n=1 Tax=Dryococelus australis TaxID=614101 RepID=A0ABQ9GBQ5_9NEOP|nr:hypothetical protein PR048_028604 [Dryococelus australis]
MKTKAGQAAESALRYKHWPWAKQQMEFLRPFLSFAPTQSNIQCTDASDTILTQPEAPASQIEDAEEDVAYLANSTDINLVPGSSTSSPQNMTQRKRKSSEECQNNAKAKNPSAVDRVLKYLETRSCGHSSDLDATELIFLGYAKQVRSLSSKRRQSVAKLKIAQIIHELELDEQEEAERTTSSASSGSSPIHVSQNLRTLRNPSATPPNFDLTSTAVIRANLVSASSSTTTPFNPLMMECDGIRSASYAYYPTECSAKQGTVVETEEGATANSSTSTVQRKSLANFFAEFSQ